MGTEGSRVQQLKDFSLSLAHHHLEMFEGLLGI
jgi:hypothetical protein